MDHIENQELYHVLITVDRLSFDSFRNEFDVTLKGAVSHRVALDGLVNIGIDETSYKKGHKYITVIVNHDTNTVVWASEGHGKSVLEKFYKQLTPEQLSSIRVVTGDGAKWITECVNEYTPDCARSETYKICSIWCTLYALIYAFHFQTEN